MHITAATPFAKWKLNNNLILPQLRPIKSQLFDPPEISCRNFSSPEPPPFFLGRCMVKFGRHLRGQSESISVIVMSEAGNAVNVVLMAVRDLFFGCINLFSTAFGALERSMNSVFFYSFIVGGPLATYAIFRFIGPF